ncbi:MAG: NUDIX domain-containing protein [Flavobacteriales bacterium]|jgi:8-oxo-dGTP diphosphatase|nr:NUDIX domain-containing protein [Flavobacteriales bacterium]|tara:strand:- start:901 stop:1299 length:399 start_codon:yes stop_codon:yes gene_type:complete
MKLKGVVCIILYDINKKVLLQHRTKDTKIFPDYWAFFGGSIENEETPKEAAIREVYEELNFTAKDLKLVMRQNFNLLGKKIIKNVFIELCKNKSSLKLKEGQDWGWYAIDETKKLKMIPHDRKALEKIDKII